MPIMWHNLAMTPLDSIETPLRLRLEEHARKLRKLDGPERGPLRDFVLLLDGIVAELDQAVGLEEKEDALVRHCVLQGAFPIFLFARKLKVDAAWSYLMDIWERLARTFGIADKLFWRSVVADSSTSYLSFNLPLEREFLVAFQAVVFEILRESENQARGRTGVRRLLAHLGLSYDQLGRAFNVSGETVRRWERGSHPIPDERLADLSSADSALGRLLVIFQPERLPQALRRKAELFGGETALDWILRGRMGEVADRYETALVYQG